MTDTFVLAKQEADAHFAVATEWHSGLSDLVIRDDAQQEQVAEVLRRVKARYREIEDKRKEITVPLNAALRAVNDLFRPPRERFEALERMLKDKIAAYLREKSAANVAALQAVSVAATPAQATAALATVAPVAPPVGVSVRHVWKFEVTDPDLVPRELCSPDPKKIGQLAPGTDVPGVRWFQEPVVSARR